MRELIERTGPKLPSIVNKNLTVLPWDWELPSTILRSKWARKHTQSFRDFSNNGESFCAQGLVYHYYGWNGKNRCEMYPIRERLESIKVNPIWDNVVYENDRARFRFNVIGCGLQPKGL